MDAFNNADGKIIWDHIVSEIQDKKDYLGYLDGKGGDGDHGINMNKGFTIFQNQCLIGDCDFIQGLSQLGMVLLTQIGGSMGPIYGTIFMSMADALPSDTQRITLENFATMLQAGYDGLLEIIEARVGDKTLVDTLSPAVDSLKTSLSSGSNFAQALLEMKKAAVHGRDSTLDMVAKYGRSSRTGERSRSMIDAGAASCCIILCAMADGILSCLHGVSALQDAKN